MAVSPKQHHTYHSHHRVLLILCTRVPVCCFGGGLPVRVRPSLQIFVPSYVSCNTVILHCLVAFTFALPLILLSTLDKTTLTLMLTLTHAHARTHETGGGEMAQIDRKRARSSKKAVRRKARRQVRGAALLVINWYLIYGNSVTVALCKLDSV